jgi:hypothetical protein
MNHNNRKKLRNSHVLKSGCSFLRAEGFSCSSDVLYGGLGISKIAIFDPILLNFGSSKPRIRIRILFLIGIPPKMLYPDPESINPDPKQCPVG